MVRCHFREVEAKSDGSQQQHHHGLAGQCKRPPAQPVYAVEAHERPEEVAQRHHGGEPNGLRGVREARQLEDGCGVVPDEWMNG